MKKLLKFCFAAIALIAVIVFLIWALLSVTKGSEYAGGFLSELTGGKIDDLLQDVKEGGSKLIDNVLEGYEGLEGYDIDEAAVFDPKEPIESGDIDRFIDHMNAASLCVELSGCTLEILDSEDGTCRITAENAGKLQAYVKEDELQIKATGNAQEITEGGKIYLYLPAGYFWQEIDLEVGAGVVRAAGLNAAKLTAECALGSVELHLSGSGTDYDYEIECVAGNITIGEEQYGGSVVKDKKIDNDAGRMIDLECSMGNISVVFEEVY